MCAQAAERGARLLKEVPVPLVQLREAAPSRRPKRAAASRAGKLRQGGDGGTRQSTSPKHRQQYRKSRSPAHLEAAQAATPAHPDLPHSSLQVPMPLALAHPCNRHTGSYLCTSYFFLRLCACPASPFGAKGPRQSFCQPTAYAACFAKPLIFKALETNKTKGPVLMLISVV